LPVRRPKPQPVKLFCGLIGREEIFTEVLPLLEAEFGSVDLETRPVSFDFTDYYKGEMGPSLFRRWVGFSGLRERAYLACAKHLTMAVEERLAHGDNRTVNIDPGYVDDAQVVLATAKNYAHRIYIGMGYYAEPALIYVKGRWHPLRWTYPDYRDPMATEFFDKARKIYHRDMR
jgi:hypothetical protein